MRSTPSLSCARTKAMIQADVRHRRTWTPAPIVRSFRARRSRLGGERRELLAAKGCACEPPTALGCLGKYHPSATGLGRVAGDLGHDLGDLFDELLLTFAGQRRWRRDDLDTDRPCRVGRCGVNRARVHSVDERGGVVQVEGAGSCHTFRAKNGHRKLLAKQTIGPGREKVCRCIHVDHGHSYAPSEGWIYGFGMRTSARSGCRLTLFIRTPSGIRSERQFGVEDLRDWLEVSAKTSVP